jgi:hypothetical protein
MEKTIIIITSLIFLYSCQNKADKSQSSIEDNKANLNTISENNILESNETKGKMEQYDSFGGNLAFKGKATGFFHIEKFNERYFFITPEGNGYRALGINHFHMITSTDYDDIIQNIKNLGFNAGCYQGPQWMWHRYPYTQGINLVQVCWWMPDQMFSFKDVFDPDYLNELEEKVKKIVEPQKDNKMLLGYFWTDIPIWTRKRGDMGWIEFYKTLPTKSPGGKVWREWEKNNPVASDLDFISVIAKQLYAKGHEFVRKYDQNHLIFGDRYHEPDMPDVVLQEIMPYIDAIAIQPTSKEFNAEFYDMLYEKYGKPLYIADHVSSYATDKHPVTMGQVAKDPESYIKYYERYVTAALSRPYMIGFNKCQYQDEMATEDMLKQGLINFDEEPYPIVEGVKKANLKALEYVYNYTNEY